MTPVVSFPATIDSNGPEVEIREPMNSVVSSPVIDFVKALSYASPALPVDEVMPYRISFSVNFTAVYWPLESE